jgi:uncharacterized glyoxalase superfamily protein PhnB
MLMIEREWPSLPSQPPAADGSSPVVLFVYVEDVDRTLDRAVAAGAKVLVPLANQFWGDRTAWIVDPAGHVWTIASRGRSGWRPSTRPPRAGGREWPAPELLHPLPPAADNH